MKLKFLRDIARLIRLRLRRRRGAPRESSLLTWEEADETAMGELMEQVEQETEEALSELRRSFWNPN